MKVQTTQFTAEIASLQRRADQLVVTAATSERVLAALAIEEAAARSERDLAGGLRLSRKIVVAQRNKARVVSEINTLLELIAARRARCPE